MRGQPQVAPGQWLGVNELQAELAKTRGQVEAWRQRLIDEASEHCNQQQRSNDAARELILQLLQQHRSLQARSQKLEQHCDEQSSELEALKDIAQHVQQEKAALQRQLALLQENYDIEALSDQQTRKGILDKKYTIQKVSAALGKATAMYCTRFGLAFEHQGDNLEVRYSHINKADPEKIYMFAIRVLPDNLYQITRCCPEVPSLQLLVDHLNATNDFAGFVHAMRQKFRSLSEH